MCSPVVQHTARAVSAQRAGVWHTRGWYVPYAGGWYAEPQRPYVQYGGPGRKCVDMGARSERTPRTARCMRRRRPAKRRRRRVAAGRTPCRRRSSRRHQRGSYCRRSRSAPAPTTSATAPKPATSCNWLCNRLPCNRCSSRRHTTTFTVGCGASKTMQVAASWPAADRQLIPPPARMAKGALRPMTLTLTPPT